MPAVLAAVDEDVHGACAQGGREAMETWLAKDPADEVLQWIPQVQAPEGEIFPDSVIGHRAHEGAFLPFGHVASRFAWKVWREPDRVLETGMKHRRARGLQRLPGSGAATHRWRHGSIGRHAVMAPMSEGPCR